jgi:peptide/nickel transport system substrate-binding protein
MKRLLLGLVCVLALVIGACGGDSSSSSSGSDKATTKAGEATKTEAPSDAKKGGTLTMLSNGDIDWADPGQMYYQFSYQFAYSIYRTLYSFKPDNPTDPVPDLAADEPEVSDDQKTITIKIRPGVKFGPPVNREVTSKDVKYAIERAFTSNVPSGYAFSYFAAIEGAPTEPIKMSELKPFSGLQTPDDSTLVIKLTKPRAALVTGALVLPITAPVPPEYAKKFDAKSPTDYDQYAVASGPYMIENDPKTGELTGREAGKKLTVVRNPNWDGPGTGDYRPAYLDKIIIEEGNADGVVASRRTLSGESLVCCGDASAPPAAILARLARTPDQYGRGNSGGAHWAPMNTTIAPFDNVDVRRAAIAITDRFAIRKIAGGEFIGPIAESFIPPGMPGNEESGGLEGFKDFDWMQCADGGCPDVAKKHMLEAKKAGVPVDADGKYTGDANLQLVVASDPDSVRGAESLQQDLSKIGLDIKIRQVPQDTLYTKFLGIPKQQPALATGVGWVKDFADAETLIAPIFPSNTIRPAGNVNWSQLRSKAVDEAVKKAQETPAGPERDQAWADANKAIVNEAPAILTTWDDNIQIQSKNVAGVMSSYNASWDLNFTSLK